MNFRSSAELIATAAGLVAAAILAGLVAPFAILYVLVDHLRDQR